MAKVKINKDDCTAFEQAAAAAGVTVEQWLTAAGRQQALIDTITSNAPGARIIHVPVDAVTAAALDAETARTGTTDAVYAARCLRDIVAAPDIDPERLWESVLADLSLEIASKQQLSSLSQAWIDTIVGDTVLLVTVDTYTRDVIESRLRPSIDLTLTEYLHRPVQIAVTVAASETAARRGIRPRASGRPAGMRPDDLRTLRELADSLSHRFGAGSAALGG